MNGIYLVSGARTPMGAFQGSLAGFSATELGAAAIRATVERAALPGSAVDEVIMGCVLPAGLGQGPARQASLGAGLPEATGCTTVNKLCGSGMKAVMLAHDLISAGSNAVMIAGGMESMSNAPYLLHKARGGLRMGHAQAVDHMFFDGLEDARSGRLMGAFAEDIAQREGFDRATMDAYAIESLRRTRRAIDEQLLDSEIVPLCVTGRQGETWVRDDEQPRMAQVEKIPNLKPAFAANGSITAANASSISDGASALLLMSATALEQHAARPLVRIVAHATHSQAPSEFCSAPVGAIQKVLDKAGWRAAEVDLFEINEAFALVALLAIRELRLDHARVNIFGGACAQGHPIGSTGSRIILTLINALQRTGGRRGVASLCIGGGEATAIAIERV